ncbi:G2/mitotic-specific cyclin [Penicillium malachiteum]|uniref:G2/mitotic-specific cyclin n=1 Tax=Penicillium malachiteum TaxID=1324776 RepID=A0AAD6HRH1_9EURO|nr:G2/mitotic-specific cyclin [Penicillium malachiteum]
MAPARTLRSRATMNENDENGPSTRLTRAKAAQGADGPADAIKKPIQQVTRATSTTGPPRRRAALGDVSNVNKTDGVETKDGKKAIAGKAGLSSKTTTQSGAIQKPTRVSKTRVPPAKPRTESNSKKPISKRAQPPIKEPEEEPPLKRQITQKPAVITKVDTLSRDAGVDNKSKPDEPVEQEWDNLDEEDLDDPLMAAEYVVEIFEYLQQLELSTLPNPQYIEHQPDLEWKMRGILVDWLIEVHTRFRLLPETLFLAVNIIDRFLSAEQVALDRLQLVGVTAMFIASKYEEVLSPHVANFSHVADETFTDKEILDAERHVLAILGYNMSFPNPMNFLRRISKADNYDIQTRTLGKYLMEISLLDHRFMSYPQSQIAAAAMYLARLILERGPWDATLAHYAGYTEEEIDPVFRLMIDYLHRPVSHEAFFKKYASKKFMKASILTRQWAKKYHHMYIDSSLAEPYTYLKDSEQ